MGNERLNHLFSLQDKLGPFCRSAIDCSLVLDAIRGKDPNDFSSRHIPVGDPFLVDVRKLIVGYLEDADMDVSETILSFFICILFCL